MIPKLTNIQNKHRRIDSISIFNLFQIFKSEDDIIDYFYKSRYGQSLVCPHCKMIGHFSRKKNERKAMYQCNSCNNSFSIFKGTIFEDTRTDLRKWMYAILQISTNAKKGISACQLQRDISVTYKCAWRMLNQIRKAMANDTNFELFKTVVEIDETYIGGKPRKGVKKSEKPKRGRGTTKIPVVGILDRESGRVIAEPMFPEKEKTALSGKQLFELIRKRVSESATHITDEFKGYNILRKKNRKHKVVNHSKWFVSEEGFYTNGIENFWSLVKRMHYGTYHKFGNKYIDLYLAEEAFRYSNRFNLETALEKTIKQAVIG